MISEIDTCIDMICRHFGARGVSIFQKSTGINHQMLWVSSLIYVIMPYIQNVVCGVESDINFQIEKNQKLTRQGGSLFMIKSRHSCTVD